MTTAMRLVLLAALALGAAPAAAQSQSIPPDLERACRPEVQRLCRWVLPGGGRILQCLRDKAPQVSDACKAALREAEQNGTIPAR